MIWFDDTRKDLVHRYLQSEAKAYAHALESTTALIDGFESPFGMELLATVDWLLAREGVAPTVPALRELTPAQRERSIVLVQDAFTRYFETPLLSAFIDLANRLGHRVFLAPYSANGKPLHVQGFLGAFAKAAIRNASQLKALADCGVPLVGLDPAMTLVYRQEYQ